MTLRLALRALASQPVRSLVLACGFGAGIAAMAGLLGIGEVILEQSRAPALRGGGDLVVWAVNGRLGSARFLLSRLHSPPLAERTVAASPTLVGKLYLVEPGQSPLAVMARGGIPSLERALGDPDTGQVDAWRDASSDAAWTSPDPSEVLRAMDRFHPIPDAPDWDDSWAEWLYFNGRADDARFYLTFLVGPGAASGPRRAGVRLQLERGGTLSTYFDAGELSEEELARAPDLRIGGNEVRLDGMRYRIRLALFAEREDSESSRDRERRSTRSRPELTGEITLDAVAGRSVPPLQIHGASGWITGYVVPVLSGALGGSLQVEGETISVDGAQGYHDHNWGFWEGVTWQWGQVSGGDLSFVYGRVRPPAAAADPERMPGLLVALGPHGPVGFSDDAVIEEVDDPTNDRPRAIVVRGSSETLDLEMRLTIDDAIRTRLVGPFAGEGRGIELLQLRARYHVVGQVRDERIDFEAPGSAETFRGH